MPVHKKLWKNNRNVCVTRIPSFANCSTDTFRNIQLNNKCVTAQSNLVFVSVRHNQQERNMLMQGLEPITLVSDEYWYRALTYLAVSEYV